jgi:Dolichyl-phosphate-mannose-protein mannosyltransferase
MALIRKLPIGADAKLHLCQSTYYFITLKNQIKCLCRSPYIVWIIIFAGIILRSIQYKINRSLWLDEAFLALNIVDRSFLELLKPLDNDQIAPVGFLLIERLNVQLFGNNEYVLRLFPLIAGISSLFLFYFIARRTVKKEASFIAVLLFSLSASLIYYSSEVKQYSSDVFVAIVLYAITLHIESEKLSIPYVFLYGAVGAIAIWFSNPSVFILTGIGASLLSTYMKKKEWSDVRRLSTIISIWLLSFLSLYNYIVSPLKRSGIVNNMQKYHKDSFMPFPPLSLSDFQWFMAHFFGIFSNPVGISFVGIASLAFLIGCISMVAKNKQLFFLLLSPVMITLLASGFRTYPFTDRLILFLVPSLLLFIAEGVEYIRDKTRSTSPVIGIMLIGLLLFYPILAAGYHAIKQKPYQTMPIEDIKTILRYLGEHRKNVDTVYLYYASEFAFRYYAQRYGINENEYVVGIVSRNDWKGYMRDLDKLRGKKRVWLLFSHVYTESGVDEERLFVHYLDTFGTCLDYLKADGASIYLYDLSEEV